MVMFKNATHYLLIFLSNLTYAMLLNRTSYANDYESHFSS